MCSLSLVNIRVNRLSKLPSTHPVFFSLSLDLAAFSFQRDSFFVLIQLGYQPSGDIGWWKRHPVKAFLSFTMAVLQNKRNFLWVFLGSGDLFLCGQWPVVHYKCLTIARQKKKKKAGGILICRIFQLPWCTYSHSGQLQAIDVILLNTNLEKDEYNWLPQAGKSWLQHIPSNAYKFKARQQKLYIR